MSGHEETLRLIELAQSGNEAAKERLVLENIALVKSLLRGFAGRGAEWDDLLQLGSIGLLKAIIGYDKSFGVRFSTYAVPMITGEIRRFLRDDGMVKVSRSLRETAYKVNRAAAEFAQAGKSEATIEELSEKTGFSKEEIISSLEAVRPAVSIYEPVSGDGDDLLLIDRLGAEDESESIIDRMDIEKMLQRLNEKERKLIHMRFFREMTQEQIAKVLGTSQVQVSRMLGRTIKKIREKLSAL